MKRRYIAFLAFAVAAWLGAPPVDLADAAQRGKPKANSYYIDDTDAGDDKFSAGCHWSFSDNQCTQSKTFYKGDYCTDSTKIQEYTNQVCHGVKPPDRVGYDCDAECKKIGALGGSCVTVENACGPKNHSARCKCDYITMKRERGRVIRPRGH